MIATSSLERSQWREESLHRPFLELLPRLERRARTAFRRRAGAEDRAELVAEVVALAWKWHLRLAERGKDTVAVAAAFIGFAVLAVACGRRLCGRKKAKDALTRAPRPGRAREDRPPGLDDTWARRHLVEALADNTQSPVFDQVVFRVDFRAWCGSRTERDRGLIEDLMRGERALDVARKHGLSPARVSQMRREFCADWQRFTDPERQGMAALRRGSPEPQRASD